MENIAVILAGGLGARFSSEIPKQFVKIDDKEILKMTVEKFKISYISKIVVVVIEEWIDYTQALLADFNNVYIISGGKNRTESSKNALTFVQEKGWKNSFVLIHDGARPFVLSNIIEQLIEEVQIHDAVVLCGRSNNTLYYAENSFVDEILDREKIFEAQTPQCFKFDIIFDAYGKIQDGESFTDDASVIHKYSPQAKIKIVSSTDKNTKITFRHELD